MMIPEAATTGLRLLRNHTPDIQTRQARVIYLPERQCEGKRNAVERRHNIIIADKTFILFVL